MDHKTIAFDVSERTLSSDDAGKWISFNDDYIAMFRFDSEWDGKIKTAEFIQGKDKYKRVLEDDKCEVPPLKSGLVRVGVYTSKMTSTPVIIGIKRSIKDFSGVPAEPPEDVYAQLTALIESGILKGDDGLTPYVGENNNWWIGDVDTGIIAHGYTPVKGVDYFTDSEVKQIQNEVSSGAIGNFKAVVDAETETFNNNAETKFLDYNSNSESKVAAYNQNDSEKTEAYNSNAQAKVADYNTNADNRVAEFNAQTEQIQTDISGLKSDLANKLPKSPADWEQWTAEEQAMARVRMGADGGTMELLVDAVLEEDAKTFVVQIPKSCEEIIYHTWTFNDSGANLAVRHYVGDDSLYCLARYAALGTGSGISTNGFAKHIGNIENYSIVGYSTYSISSNWTSDNNGNGASLYMTYPHDGVITKISRFKMTLDTGVLKAGTVIRIWGR